MYPDPDLVKEKETEAGLKVNMQQAIAKRLETQANISGHF